MWVSMIGMSSTPVAACRARGSAAAASTPPMKLRRERVGALTGRRGCTDSGPEVGLEVGLESGVRARIVQRQAAARAAAAAAARRDAGGGRGRPEVGVGLEDPAGNQEPVLVGGAQAGKGEDAPKHGEALLLAARVPEV